jgi:iron complex outermembrane receptor protein
MKIRFFALSLLTSSLAFADEIKQLAPTVVTATRVETNSFDLPVSIDVVEKKDLDGQLGMTLSESLIRTPGVTAQNRNQMAQDPQISSRGFGSRSAFGVRGVRVLVDGIPLTMPDGIGQPGSVDLDNLKSVEVMRGPFSSLYGNSSGGIINMRTIDISKVNEINAGILFGSFNTKKEKLGASGNLSGVDYLISISNFSTDGFRQNGETDKNQATLKLSTKINEDTKITILGNWFDQRSQDPQGLNKVLFDANPRSAPVASLETKARVIRNNTQLGFNLEHNLNANNTINLMAYTGHRYNSQYLPTSVSQSASVSNPDGKNSYYQRSYYGNDLRWTNTGKIYNQDYSLTTGINYGYMSDARMEKSTYKGIMALNAATKRDEVNVGYNFDQYMQGQLNIFEKIDFHAGLRRSLVNFRIDDHFFTNDSNNGSGNVSYQKTTPVIGVIWKQNPNLNFYANFGKGFETPTFIEMAYSDPSSGGKSNFSLTPSESDNFEVGVKSFLSNNTRINAALFKTNTYQEIIAQTTGTYSVYMNAGKTSREGFEASLDTNLPQNFNFYSSYSYIDAKFETPFQYKDNQYPTPTEYQVLKGMKIPGTYKNQIYAELSWRYPEFGFKAALEARHNSSMYVNNANTASAPAYTIYNLRAGFEQNLQKWKVSEFLRVENLTDKDYIGSTRVNDGKLYFYEPGASINYLAGINASYQF